MLPVPILGQHPLIFQQGEMVDLCCFCVCCSAEVLSLVFHTDLQGPLGSGPFHMHCPEREEEARQTSWLPGEAEAELTFPPITHHCFPSKGQTLFRFPLPLFR